MHRIIPVKKLFFVILLICLCLMVSCVGPLKNVLSALFPDQQDQEALDTSSMFASVNGADCIPNLSSYETATLIDIIDGDSIRVAIQGTVYEVRYIGMNTPEYYSDQRQAAIEATQYNKDLISSANIYLFKDISETDRYDRLLRYVIANGKFINLELVRSGHAQSKIYKPDVSCQPTFDRANN
ncbi:MAG: thermonuclease family protein [Pelolinea sp.]|nr:thermonuclease family protein [Pelolinea sp.]